MLNASSSEPRLCAFHVRGRRAIRVNKILTALRAKELRPKNVRLRN